MTIEVFAEKFRGFKKIHLKLDNMTFLTGDNSSGKSSILLLIHYIFTSELTGSPTLSEDLTTDSYDFFSPYFNFANVTIGFIKRGEKHSVGKVITLKRCSNGYSPKVIKKTWVEDQERITIKSDKQSTSYKATKFESDLTIESLLKLHRERGKFTSIKLTDEDAARPDANSFELLFSLRLNNANKKIVSNLFSSCKLGNLPDVLHSGPVRGLPEPFYRLDRHLKTSGTHFASMWHDMSQSETSAGLEIVKRFGQESRLFDELKVEVISKKISNSPMLVKVKQHGKEFLLGQVGVGVSQVIPVVVDAVYASGKKRPRFLLQQQPELHLHPIAQAALGEFMYSMTKQKISYVVETHSDFLIDRFRSLIRDDKNPSRCQIIFCENTEKGNIATVIAISERGEIQNAPDNYKVFFVNELLRTMF